jgi:hypothetical protein
LSDISNAVDDYLHNKVKTARKPTKLNQNNRAESLPQLVPAKSTRILESKFDSGKKNPLLKNFISKNKEKLLTDSAKKIQVLDLKFKKLSDINQISLERKTNLN